MQGNYETTETSYGWWFYRLAIKVKTCLNNMHPSIKFTFEEPKVINENKKKRQVLNFLDVKIILHEGNLVETDIYYKPTNTHKYLPLDSEHPNHT